MPITHDSVTLTSGVVSHRWTDGKAFAYHWREGASTLLVGLLREGALGPNGWTFTSPAAVQRVYVRRWSATGPLLFGANTSDPDAAWHDPAEVEAVVRTLIAEQWSPDCFLFQFESARFLGPNDGQMVMLGKSGQPSSGGNPLPRAVAESGDLVPVEAPLPPLSVEGITADSLAEQIREALA